MKKFMILLLAIGMLFSFAACSNESDTTVSGGLAQKIYSDDTPVIVEGEKVDLSMWTLKGLDSFNNPVAIDASEVTITDGDKAIVLDSNDGVEKVETKDVAVTTSWGATGTLKVVVLPVTEIEVDAENAATTEYFAVIGTAENVDKAYKNGLIDKTGVKVTATYIDQDGKEQEKVVDNALVDFSISNTDWEGGNDKTVTISYAGETDATTFKVDIVTNRVETLTVEVAADYKPIASASTALDTNKFVVYGTYQNGQKVALTNNVTYCLDTAYNDQPASKDYKAASAILFSEAGPKTVYVKYAGAMVENGNRYTSGSVTAVADALKGLVVKVNALTLKADYDYSETYPTEVSVEAEYNGTTPAIALVAKTDWTLSPLTAKEGLEAGDLVTFTITPTSTGKAAGLDPVTFQVAVGTEYSQNAD